MVYEDNQGPPEMGPTVGGEIIEGTGIGWSCTLLLYDMSRIKPDLLAPSKLREK